MTKTYDVWWQKGQESDDDMARDHQEAWERTIKMLDTSDIKGCLLYTSPSPRDV